MTFDMENHKTIPEDTCNGKFFSRDPEIPVNHPTKIFCDPVHGQIAFHPACVAIIDTPQFQRLRSIKQTGFLDYVFPGATQNRFSHSLGVCYLAGKFIQELREGQPELSISDTDVLCVELAGLCHDLGHGPYSHTWEKYIQRTGVGNNCSIVWKHEMVSANILDYLIDDNNLMPVLQGYGVGLVEIKHIKDCITGVQPEDPSKAFLYQIVNNDDSGLDVDKWDYFLRDCYFLGLKCSFDYERLIQFAKVFVVHGKYQVCYRDKVLETVCDCFRTRSNLHRLAYQHKINIIIERMILDAFSIADGKVTGPTGDILKFWEWSMEAAFSQGENLRKSLERYCMLTDNVVFSAVKYARQPLTVKASQIMKAIETRSLKANGFYHHVGLKILPRIVKECEIVDGLCQLLPSANKEMMCSENYSNSKKPCVDPVTTADIAVCVVSITWGKGNKNPVDFVHFYSKTSVFTKGSSTCSEVSANLPKSFQEIQVHVLCRRSDNYAVRVMRQCFDKFWDNTQIK